MNVPSNNKMLYFMEQTDGAFDAAQDAVCYPISSFKGFQANGTTTAIQGYVESGDYDISRQEGIQGQGELVMQFDGILGPTLENDAYDIVTLTITANKQKEVIEAINNEIAFGGSATISIADDSNSVYADSRITACALTVLAVD